MKNIVKIFSVLMVMIGSFAFGQEYRNANYNDLKNTVSDSKKAIKLFCVTYSCCGVGPFTVQVWQDKECHYITVNKQNISVISLKEGTSEANLKEIEVKENITLVDKDETYSKQGLEMIMPAGKYLVDGNKIFFEPVIQAQKIRIVCYITTHDGEIFGHQYHFTTGYCIFAGKFNSETKMIEGGYAVVDLSENKELIELAYNNHGILRFDENLILDNYILPAGEYTLDNGKIYTRNLLLK